MAQYTLTNLIPTQVGEGTWSAGSLSTTHTLYSSKSLQLTSSTSAEIVSTYQTATIPQVQNHIYYGRIYEYHEAANLNGKGWQIYWPIAEPHFNSTPFGTEGKWNMLSARNIRNSWASGNQSLRVDFDNGGTVGTVWYDGLMLIDLTATFGSGKEPSKEWCDNNIPFFIGSKTMNLSLPTTYDLSSTSSFSLKTGDIVNCPYTGNYKTLKLKKGTYKLECWGAEGGYRSSTSYSGKGGYSVGTITLTNDTTMYLYAGGAGNTVTTATSSIYPGGFNGGGYRYAYKGGGGGSDIRINSTSLYARVIVAGGGGSDGATAKNGMYGGGTAGGASTQSFGSYGYGGSQTGFTTTVTALRSQPTTNSSANYPGGFGFGGFGIYRSSGYGGAGGGGWYGGCGVYPDGSGDDDRGGGGGSGYVYTSSTASSYPSGCLLNSSYYLTEASTTAGNVSFTSPTGTAETGHSGNGYIRITVIETGFTVTYDANGGIGAPDNQQKEAGSSINLSTIKPTKASINSPVTVNFYKLQTIIETQTVNAAELFTFTHWNTTADGTGQTYLPGDTYNLDANIVLYAQYSSSYGPAQVVMPNCDSYTEEARDMIHLISDNSIYDSIQLFGTSEYNFAGWGIDPYNTVHEQKEQEENELPQAGDTVTISENTNFYANFENILHYNSIELPILESFSRKFIGWYLPRDKKVYNGTYTPISNNYLYAVWKNIQEDGIYDVFIYKNSAEPFNEYESYIYQDGAWIKLDNYIYPWNNTDNDDDDENNNIWNDVNNRFTWAQVGALNWSGLAKGDLN